VVKRRVRIDPRTFEKEELTLPDSMVHLRADDGKRVERENGTIGALWPRNSPERMWDGPFAAPVQGRPGSPFGLRRWINGERRSFHTGRDIQAPRGTPVLASNHGRVCLQGDFFFGGKSVFVDHGQGLYTMYFHLSEILVKPGEEVRRGQILGRVGSTGRATGPHLHWGVRMGGARVDPDALVRITEQP
jgi:murein DD-endopeptidase MepM/ murein hydrolase activator NlpD